MVDLEGLANEVALDGVVVPASAIMKSPQVAVPALLGCVAVSGAPKKSGGKADEKAGGKASAPAGGSAASAPPTADSFRPGKGQLLSDSAEALMAREMAVLEDAAQLLAEACPAMQERALLSDAMKQLQELFLVVVVGEFNSGKSSVINALLGGEFLPTGILPTTNEISILRYGPEGEAEVSQEADGLYVRTMPAELLRELSIVDTPGTNVILGRQQRLTEEYVPRADLVLFVISADRPFTDSEVNFLQYIKQWGKKVVFVVNKVDQLGSEDEVAQLTEFVGENAARILGVDSPVVIPVSARKGLRAKAAAADAVTGVLDTLDASSLESDPDWVASRFNDLEQFLVLFLGGGDGAGEVVRLKLSTPLSVADALLEAAGRLLAQELKVARDDLRSVESMREGVAAFRSEMADDSAAQVSRVGDTIEGMYQKVEEAVDSVLQVSSWASASQYLFGAADARDLPVARALRGQVFGGAVDQVEALAAEHTEFVQDNCRRQVEAYTEWARARGAALGVPAADPGDGAAGTDPGALARGVVEAIREFDQEEATALLEEGTKDAVVSTATYLGGSVAGAFLLTGIMQTGTEDLLSLCLCAAAAYGGVVTLPLRRARVKQSARGQIDGVLDKVSGLMGQELSQGVEDAARRVEAAIAPVEAAARAEKERVLALQQSLAAVREAVRSMQADVRRYQ